MSDLMTNDKFPEHTKLYAVKERSQAIGEFLDWLQIEKGFQLCRDQFGELIPANVSLELLLGEHFGIDMKAIEVEKRAMLEEIRKANALKDVLKGETR